MLRKLINDRTNDFMFTLVKNIRNDNNHFKFEKPHKNYMVIIKKLFIQHIHEKIIKFYSF